MSLLDAAALGLALLHAASLTSNSFIEREGEVLHFMIVTLSLLLLRASLRKEPGGGQVAACVALLFIARCLQVHYGTGCTTLGLRSWIQLLPSQRERAVCGRRACRDLHTTSPHLQVAGCHHWCSPTRLLAR